VSGRWCPRTGCSPTFPRKAFTVTRRPAARWPIIPPAGGGFDVREEGAKPVYNAPEGRFELGGDDYEPTYDPVSGEFEMKPRDEEDEF